MSHVSNYLAPLAHQYNNIVMYKSQLISTHSTHSTTSVENLPLLIDKGDNDLSEIQNICDNSDKNNFLWFYYASKTPTSQKSLNTASNIHTIIYI